MELKIRKNGEVYINVSDGTANGGSKDGTVDVTPYYEVYDEFGDSASICNCMQLVSLYRYYYLFMDETGESDADNYWINDFKTGRMTTAWNDTHRVARNAEGTDMGKWLSYSKIKGVSKPKNVSLESLVADDIYRSALLRASIYLVLDDIPDVIGVMDAFSASCQVVCLGKQPLDDLLIDQKTCYMFE